MEALILPCTQEKIWDANPTAGPIAAKQAYTKPAFVAWRAYAEQSGCPWFILSTRYGLIRPEHVIEPYNVPISAALTDESLRQRLAHQGRELGLDQYDQIVLLDWEKFEPLVRAAVSNPSIRCVLRKLQY